MRVTLVLCGLMALAPLVLSGESIPVTGQENPKLRSLDEFMTAFVTGHEVPGAAIAITRHDKLVYARGFGYADTDAKAPIEPDSLFRIASISKPFTSVAVLQLAERGRLSLDAKVFEYLGLQPGPDGDPRLKDITILELLHHSGGWDREKSFDPMFRSVQIAKHFEKAPPASPDQIVRYMLDRKLDFEPGGAYAYSNFGYCVLGRVIEKASGKSYEDYVREQVLAPLHVNSMRLGKTLLNERAANEVHYYAHDRTAPAVTGPQIGAVVPVQYGGWCLESMDSHGGWLASAVDLVRFASAFDDPKHCPILNEQSIAVLFARPEGAAGVQNGKPKAAYYGCGWMVRPRGTPGAAGEGLPGSANQWHNGALDGTSTLLVRRYDGFTWAVLFNARNGKNSPELSATIDPLVHAAVDAIKDWPEEDLFQKN